MVLLKKLWKESATLIILGRNANNTLINGCNYKILVMKRSANAKFMPNCIVFPGGAIENSDSDKDWLTMYRSMGISDHQLKALTPQQERRPIIYDRMHTIHGGAGNADIERDISLRITAVRETFEEMGILIGKTKDKLCATITGQMPFSNALTNFDVKHWQKEVRNDSRKFRQLYHDLRVAPDLWTIYEWTNWLTPVSSIFGLKRFDVSFYLVALPDQPDVVAEQNEVQEYMWSSPQELLDLNARKQIKVPPPQQYELCRLMTMDRIETVIQFAKERNKLGTTLYYPVLYRVRDGLISLLPGDDAYPLNPKLDGVGHDINVHADKTLAELQLQNKNLHRLEDDLNGELKKIVINITIPNGHIDPTVPMKSKL